MTFWKYEFNFNFDIFYACQYKKYVPSPNVIFIPFCTVFSNIVNQIKKRLAKFMVDIYHFKKKIDEQMSIGLPSLCSFNNYIYM